MTNNGSPTKTCAVQGSSDYPLCGRKCSIWQGGTTRDRVLAGPFLSNLNVPAAVLSSSFVTDNNTVNEQSHWQQ